MDLSYSQEYEQYREKLREFLKANWPLPEELGDLETREREFRRRAAEAGYMYRHIPRKYGGSEQAPDFLKGEIIKQEFGKSRAPREQVDSGVQRVVPVLLQWGTEAQQEFFIPPTMASTQPIWCQGYSEPNAGSDLASLTTRAELKGDKWIINGQKIWTSKAHHAPFMNALVRTEDAPRHLGISYMMIPMRQPGIEVRPIKQITGEAEFNEVFFNNAEAPADWLIGERGQGWLVSRTTLRYERSGFGSVNWLESLVRRLVKLATETVRDGRPAIEEPALRRQIARIQARLYGMRYSAYRDLSMEGAGEQAGDFLLMQKLYLTETLHTVDRITRDLLADDFMLERPGEEGQEGLNGNVKWIENSLHSLKVAIAGGSSNIQRNIIGERVLGLPRDAVGIGAGRPETGAAQ